MDVDWQSFLLSTMITLEEDLRDLHSKFTEKTVLKVMFIHKEYILGLKTPMYTTSCSVHVYYILVTIQIQHMLALAWRL